MDSNDQVRQRLAALDEYVTELRAAVDGLPSELRPAQLQALENDLNKVERIFADWRAKLGIHTSAVKRHLDKNAARVADSKT